MASLYERYITNDDDQYGVFGAAWRAHSFTIGNTGANVDQILKSIKIQGTKVGAPGNITLDIKAVGGDGKPTGDILSTGSYNGNSFPAYPTRGWSPLISMTDCVFLADGEYCIIASIPSGNASNYVGWGHDRSSPTYTGGSCLLSADSGGTWTIRTDVDQMFEIWGIRLHLSVITEATSATETEDGLRILTAEITESATAEDEQSAIGIFNAAITEVANAGDVENGSRLYSAEITEAAEATDTQDSSRLYSAEITETTEATAAQDSYSFYTEIPPFMEKDLIDPYASGAWLWLCEIVVPTQDTVRIARNTEDVKYANKDFDKFNLQIGEQIFSGDGSIPRVTLRTFQDISRKIENIINETEGALGGAVKLVRVNEKWLTLVVSALEADYDLLASQSDSEWCTFTLGIPNPLTQRFPLEDYSSSMCPWTSPELFKGPRCQYAGDDPTCTGTYADCRAKENAEHWGGELGLSPSVVKDQER